MRITIIMGIALLTVFGAMAQQTEWTANGQSAERTIRAQQTISGSVNFVSRTGTELEETRALGICAGRGTFGSYTCTTLTLIPPGNDMPVGYDTEDCPEKYEFSFPATAGHVQRFAKGDVLYWRKDNSEGAKNFYCADPTQPTQVYLVQTYQYVGGAGRFQGATGTVMMKLVMDLILTDSGGNSAAYGSHGVVEGTIHLAQSQTE